MKKLVLSVAIVLGGLTVVNAQSEKAVKSVSKSSQSVEAQAQAPSLAAAVQDYKEVKASEVPQPVKETVAKNFNGATISKAYVNAKGEYKLQLTTADKKSATVYADANGQLVKNELKKQ
ncbi:MAG TPA: hypothetical protein VKX34_08535 [Aequorivita sp.]|nr:hypothetical protein [Aequorivita sp.]